MVLACEQALRGFAGAGREQYRKRAETVVAHRSALTTAKDEFAMANRPPITPELCRQLLRYDPETGRLFYRTRDKSFFAPGRPYSQLSQANRWNGRCAGQPADAVAPSGYRVTRLFQRLFRSHRLILAMVRDEMLSPASEVDHISGDRSDNRLENLRVVDKTGNMRNQKLRSNNTSGVCGVYWNKGVRKWQAYIRVAGELRYLGVFPSIAEAAACRLRAQAEAGFHENHGKRRPRHVASRR